MMRRALLNLKADLKKYGIGILAVLAFYGVIFLVFHDLCPVYAIFKVACPGCGLTRSCIAILLGRFKLAASLNPAGFLWLPFLVYLAAFRYLLGKRPPFVIQLLIIVCLFTLGQWLFKMI